jgi:thiol-disulfide isomerase/thioredoxin
MTRLHSALVALVLAAAVPAAAQSLGEAARRANDARKAGGSNALVFDERDLDPSLARQDLLAFQIDDAAWRRFLQADRLVTDAIASDPGLLQRLKGMQASSLRSLERFFQREPALSAALKSAGTEPHEYAFIEQALALVLGLHPDQRTPERLAELPPPVRANVTFLTARERDVKQVLPRVMQLELHIAPPPSAGVSIASASASAAATPEAASGGGLKGSGPEVPDFTFTDFQGSARRLSDFRGRYVLLDFWGSWCGPCRAEVPFLKDAYARFQSRRFEVIGMDYEQGATREKVQAYLSEQGMTWTIASPETVRNTIVNVFRVSSFPTLMLIDPDGRVLETNSDVLRGEDLAKTLDMVLPKMQ